MPRSLPSYLLIIIYLANMLMSFAYFNRITEITTNTASPALRTEARPINIHTLSTMIIPLTGRTIWTFTNVHIKASHRCVYLDMFVV
jgi:hypothetical protein